ncbi:MAG: GNAT family N-acetyltransferase [Fusobacteriaceae bacterium]|jgi:ribosomal protein S18 acetylase RimI-like enzyme|nr:GNAT family N-acetyltransferase [Fusobacteriaceae bacterium]
MIASKEMASQIQFGPGKAEDAAEIYEVYRKAIAHLLAQGIDQWDEEYPNLHTIESDIGKGTLTVGKINGVPILAYVLNMEYLDGFEKGDWKGDENSYIVLHRFVVDPQYQNRGLAGIAIDYMVKQLLQRGIHSIRIDTFPPNVGSIRMYERQGFQKVGEITWRKGIYGIMEKLF